MREDRGEADPHGGHDVQPCDSAPEDRRVLPQDREGDCSSDTPWILQRDRSRERCKTDRSCMNNHLISRLLSGMQGLTPPPGGHSWFLESEYHRDRAVEVAVVFEHRFAFFYWLRWRHDRQNVEPPDLVTIDWHDDIGGNCDFNPDVLDALNTGDSNELAFFCWSGLRSLNDGHVAPALYLNAFRNVHAIIKQDWYHGSKASDRRCNILDNHQKPHTIRYHRSPSAFLRALRNDANTHPIVLDLDLDYFTREHPSGDLFRQIRLHDGVIRRTLDVGRPLMSALLPRIVGITIALEPCYCGGVLNSLHILDVVCQTLFRGRACQQLATTRGSGHSR